MPSRVRAPRQIFLSSRARLLSGLSAPAKDAGASGPSSSGSDGQRSIRSSWKKLVASVKEHAGLVGILSGAAGGLATLVYMAAGLQHQQELRVERLQKELDIQKKEVDMQKKELQMQLQKQLDIQQKELQLQRAQVGGPHACVRSGPPCDKAAGRCTRAE